MKPEVGRRAFVGTVVAGLPMLAGSSGLLAQGGLAHQHVPRATTDPVIDQIVRQIAVAHNSALVGPRAAHARAVAAQLRMLSVYLRQQRIDDQVRVTVKDMVAREGRTAVLYAPPDVDARRTMMQAYGFEPDARMAHVQLTATHAAREAALDELLKDGITPTYDRLAATLERHAGMLDRRNRRMVTIAQDEAYWAGYCAELWEQFQRAQLMALPFCLTMKYLEWFAPACAGMEGGAIVLLAFYVVQC